MPVATSPTALGSHEVGDLLTEAVAAVGGSPREGQARMTAEVARAVNTSEHLLVQADAMAWLEGDRGQYDVIFCDPPTFSNSARAEDFDVQRDHVRLLRAAMARLAQGGVLYFSNNFRRFRLDEAAVAQRNATTPLRRIGEIEDIAATALFLASDAGRFITGQQIAVDGGTSITDGS